MQNSDPDGDGKGDIVSGPEPSRLPRASDVVSAVRGLFAARPKRATAEPVAQATAPPATPTTPTRAQVLSGAPAWVLAPAYLAFAAAFALPQAAKLAEPEAPRQFIAGVVARLPGWAAPMESVWNGWLWAPWWVVLPAFLMRLNSVRITLRASLDAVGSSMAALVISGAAWLYWGRTALGREGVPVAERDGAWQLLVAEFVFLFLIATWFSPNMGKRTQFEQG